MKILQINTVYAEGSTGKIARDIHDLCLEAGFECRTACRSLSAPQPDAMEISGRLDSRIHGLLARMTMFKGCFSYFKTRRFLKRVNDYRPDVIHLHNLHGSYVHVGLLMRYIKQKQIPVVFTLHDCWAFTAICPHFTIAGCDKWKTGCHHCPQRRQYSSSPFDMTASVWRLKRKWFSGVPRMIIVTPSAWLQQLAQTSLLAEYPVRVIHNGINLNLFTPTPSDFRERHNLGDRKIVLAVAFGWGYSKGLDVIATLAERLPEDYRLVVVGTDERAEAQLPSQVLSIRRTKDQHELAAIYTAADVLINPTREENYPTVNMEAIACGTPVITFRTGGSPEIVSDACGVTVERDDIDAMEREIRRVCSEHPYSEKACLSRARQFDHMERLQEYVHLYQDMRK